MHIVHTAYTFILVNIENDSLIHSVGFIWRCKSLSWAQMIGLGNKWQSARKTVFCSHVKIWLSMMWMTFTKFYHIQLIAIRNILHQCLCGYRPTKALQILSCLHELKSVAHDNIFWAHILLMARALMRDFDSLLCNQSPPIHRKVSVEFSFTP